MLFRRAVHNKQVKKILVVRNDKIGDFMLAWPAFRALKEQLPECEVVALVPGYTEALARLCPWIDRPLLDPGPGAGIRQLASLLRREGFDAVITLFSTSRIALACWLAGIPYRLAPATKWAQLFYNERLAQRRSRSEKPEWAYNLDLAQHFLRDLGVTTPAITPPPFLEFAPGESARLRTEFCTRHGLDPANRLVFVHAGSGGSAVNLDLQQYARLIRSLRSAHPLSFVLTAGPGEEARARALASLMQPMPSTLFCSDRGLADFARHIALADLWISGSTGPLHIAGALDRPTAAFYARRRSATPLRWQTLNRPEHRLTFTPPPSAGESDMNAIDLDAAAAEISARFLS